MKKMLHVIALTAIAGLAVAPTLAAAQGESPTTLTCLEFSKMDSAGMTMAIGEMHTASPEGNQKWDDAVTQEKVASTMQVCEGNPTKLAMDAMLAK